MLSEYQRHLFYECVDIPDVADILSIDGSYGTGQNFVNGAVLTGKTLIDERLAGLSDALQTRLVELLDEWKQVSTSNVRISANNANEGVSLNPAQKRRIIRQRVKSLIGLVTSERVNQGIGIPVG